jgi:EAL and modified HD-GYP domain-containing signal transduction protein
MFIARQPIFDRDMNVYGYELLYRMSEQACCYGSTTYENSTATVLGGLFELGLERIVGNKKAFVNFDYKFLLSDAIELINPKTLVIEVLENVEVDDLLLKRIEELNKKGYKIALDDFSENLQSYPIVPIANIIKYDILITPLDKIEADVKDAIAKNKVVLAEKIETEQEYIKAKKMGFHLFQGYFFSKPQIIGGLRTRKTANTVYQRIMSELHSEEPSYQRLTDIVATDINMAYRVMRASGNESNKKTIKGALVKMGLRELERWVNVLMLQELSDNKPQELIKMSLVRSKFGELIAAHSKFSKRRYEISLMCLFSILDAMLDQTMEIALDGVDVSSDVKEVLIYHKGNLKPIYEMVIGYEQGTNILSNQKFVQIEVDQSKLFTWYLEAIAWAEDVMCSIR